MARPNNFNGGRPKKALSTLNANILYMWGNGLSYREIAAICRISKNSVASAIFNHRTDRPKPVSVPRDPNPAQSSSYVEKPVVAYRQSECDWRIASRARLREALYREDGHVVRQIS
jgi:hypothetical protein